MPVYEQKLISPLAVRFTQEHIRTTFQDGRVVEDSVDDIKVRPAPAGCDYDLILEAPFPSIEILRWRHPAAVKGAAKESDSMEHWFSLDNRRLYCLQVAAMEHWPRRVAAEVDILYDSHKVWRKYDSTTFGRAVSIGHSCKGPEVDFWDWSMEAEATCAVDVYNSAAFVVTQRDDQRANVDELTNAGEDLGGALSSSLARLLRMEAQCKDEAAVLKPCCPTPGTSTAASEDCDSVNDVSEEETNASDNDEHGPSLSTIVDDCLSRGVWHGSRGETYFFRHGNYEGHWKCTRQDSSGASKSFLLAYDWDYDLIWWGTAGTYFASAAQLAESLGEIQWYGSKDLQMRKPKFSVHMRGDSDALKPSSGTSSQPQQLRVHEQAKRKSANKRASRHARVPF